jgi:hypothetical protein
LLDEFNGCTSWLVLGVLPGEEIQEALERLAGQGVQAVENGSQCLVLDDSVIYQQRMGWLDPILAVSTID